jgi:pimeloyl-ACP methyl ester carboxylesterase
VQMQSGFIEHSLSSPDGLKISARDYGSENPATRDRAPLVCLAGLTRNGRDFHPLALMLANAAQMPRRVITIDTRGRGNSDWDSDASHYTVLHEAGDVMAVCAALNIDRAAFVGTSRGGLILHVLAAAQPSLLAAVILNDVGPAIGIEGLRHIQSYLGKRPSFGSLKEAAEAMKRVHTSAFPKLSDADWIEFADATLKDRGNGLEPDHDPAISESMAQLDLSQPLPELWEQFDLFKPIPLMTIRGENSVLLTEDIVARMAAANPDMELIQIPDQGHAPLLHLDGIAARIKAFLDRNV